MDLVKLLPERPQMSNEELNAWLMEHGGRGREVLTYRKDKVRNPLTEQLEPVARCTCSVCGGEWLTNVYGYNGTYPEFENHNGIRLNGQATTCPECGAAVEAAYYTINEQIHKMHKIQPFLSVRRRPLPCIPGKVSVT